MKVLFKIYGKYMVLAWGITFLLLAVNLMVFIGIATDQVVLLNEDNYSNNQFLKLKEAELFKQNTEGNLLLTEAGEKLLTENGCVFLFVLNDTGNVIFKWDPGKNLKEKGIYTSGEVASFSRWYLNDYPVKTWNKDQGLLVFGYPPGSIWKYLLEYSQDFMNRAGGYFFNFILINLLCIILIAVCLGYRFYRSLQPIVSGINSLSENKSVSLKESGLTSEIAGKINHTSQILEKQRENLEKRDMVRAEWIAGISHDIRTPLTMIVGYADELRADDAASQREREKADIIMEQGMMIKQLIDDLNLTAKLEYNSQILRKETLFVSSLLRGLAAEYLNREMDPKYCLSLQLEEQLEKITIEADRELMLRAFRNLINNSIIHNPEGCEICLKGGVKGNRIWIAVKDSGKGIPEEVSGCLEEKLSGQKASDKKKPHIMGLKIVKQIILAHNGDFKISEQGTQVVLTMPRTDT